MHHDTAMELATIHQGELLQGATRQRTVRLARFARRNRRRTTTQGA
ncbi:MAG TPA: hypothetical protein VGJ43_08855 [Acidimicrobiales bacterium]|jgi:hypothetical protein